MNFHTKGVPTLTTDPEDKQTILYSLDNLEAWCWILGFRVSLGEYFCNPFRSDSTPGCWLYEAKNGLVLLADFASPEHNGITFLHALKYIYPNKNFYEQLKAFRVDYIQSNNLTLNEAYKRKYTPSNFDFKLKSKARKFIKQDIEYWDQFEITSKQLQHEDVPPIAYYYKNYKHDPARMVKHTPLDIAYSIRINGREKIYRPYSPTKEGKWVSNLRKEDIGGKKKCKSNVLWLTKSYKDYQVVTNQEKDSRFTLNEGTELTAKFVSSIVHEFDLIIPLMDNDPTGRVAAKTYEQQIKKAGGKAYGATLPEHYYKVGITDPADLIQKKNKTQLNYELQKIEEAAFKAVG